MNDFRPWLASQLILSSFSSPSNIPRTSSTYESADRLGPIIIVVERLALRALAFEFICRLVKTLCEFFCGNANRSPTYSMVAV